MNLTGDATTAESTSFPWQFWRGVAGKDLRAHVHKRRFACLSIPDLVQGAAPSSASMASAEALPADDTLPAA